jgi:2-keto-4-pentenoate hydratase/2-oxohepta-3-ene-1,7-dioic acid hydratase in catechol pathway
MRFIAYYPSAKANRRDRSIGRVIGDLVAPIADIDEFYDDVDGHKRKAAALVRGEIPLGEILLAPPVPRDAKIICAAINYVKHGAEANLPTPTFPNLFARWTSELVVDGADVPVPAAEPDGLDWEVELAAIIGATATDVDAAQANEKIFGYTVANEISGRASQLQAATLKTGQWALGKNVEKSCALGSFVETADRFDARNAKLETIVDGTVMQSGTTADMVFSVGDLIAFASRLVTLRPGDLILTGTPDGVGLGRNPKIYMKPGSTVTVRIDGLCSVTNQIVDSSYRG